MKRQHEPQHIVGDLLTAEITEKQARRSPLLRGPFSTPNHIFQPVAGWRFAAVAAIQPELAFQFGDARMLHRYQFTQLGVLCLECRDNGLRRGRIIRRRAGVFVRIRRPRRRHGELDSCSESRVKRLSESAYLGSCQWASKTSRRSEI